MQCSIRLQFKNLSEIQKQVFFDCEISALNCTSRNQQIQTVLGDKGSDTDIQLLFGKCCVFTQICEQQQEIMYTMEIGNMNQVSEILQQYWCSSNLEIHKKN